MIILEIQLKNEAGSLIEEGAKLILFAQIIDEKFSFQYDLKLFSKDVVDYVNAKPESAPCFPDGSRIKGKNFQALKPAEVSYMQRTAFALMYNGLVEWEIKEQIFGKLGRYIYKYVKSYLTPKIGRFNLLESTFEKHLTDKIISLQRKTIIDAIQFTNETEEDQTYSITCGDYSANGTVDTGVSEIDINHYCKEDETLTITTECETKTLVKADDMSCYIPMFVSGTTVSDVTSTGATASAEIHSISSYLDVVSAGFYCCLASEDISTNAVFAPANVTGGVYSIDLNSLTPATEYRIKFKAVNSIGEEAESAIATFTTL